MGLIAWYGQQLVRRGFPFDGTGFDSFVARTNTALVNMVRSQRDQWRGGGVGRGRLRATAIQVFARSCRWAASIRTRGRMNVRPRSRFHSDLATVSPRATRGTGSCAEQTFSPFARVSVCGRSTTRPLAHPPNVAVGADRHATPLWECRSVRIPFATPPGESALPGQNQPCVTHKSPGS